MTHGHFLCAELILTHGHFCVYIYFNYIGNVYSSGENPKVRGIQKSDIPLNIYIIQDATVLN